MHRDVVRVHGPLRHDVHRRVRRHGTCSAGVCMVSTTVCSPGEVRCPDGDCCPTTGGWCNSFGRCQRCTPRSSTVPARDRSPATRERVRRAARARRPEPPRATPQSPNGCRARRAVRGRPEKPCREPPGALRCRAHESGLTKAAGVAVVRTTQHGRRPTRRWRSAPAWSTSRSPGPSVARGRAGGYCARRRAQPRHRARGPGRGRLPSRIPA